MKIDIVKFEKCQLGWRCEIGFSFVSSRQFTNEFHSVEVVRKWWIQAFLSARWQAKFHVQVHGAKKGEREVKGWSM